MSRIEEYRHDLRAIGSDAPPKIPMDGGAGTMRIPLLLASLATVGVAMWLFAVTASVLPSRDPAHIPMWRGIALAFLGYAGLSWTYLYAGRRYRLLKGMILVVSAAAVGGSLYGIFTMARVAQRGGHFEGYIVLMGLILCGHGVTAILHALTSGKRVRPLGAI